MTAPVSGTGPAGSARSYPGRELEAMSFAINYHRWILGLLTPYLGGRVVEVGAGAGSFSGKRSARRSLRARPPRANPR
jgi:hypothetical protein